MIIFGKQRDGNIRGLTLLELLIAISFLAIGLLAAAGMQGVAMNTNSLANRITSASMVGQQVVEDLSSLSAADPLLHTAAVNVLYTGMFDPVTNASIAGTRSMTGAGTFSARYDIAPNTPTAGTTRITVRIFLNGSTTPVITCSTSKRVSSPFLVEIR